MYMRGKMSPYLTSLLLYMLGFSTLHLHEVKADHHDQAPTEGFINLPLNSSNYKLQKPYNIPGGSRYTYTGGIHKFWVLSSDQPLSHKSPTAPRTELVLQGYDYSYGVRQFEGQVYVPSGTTGVCIMQIFGKGRRHSTLMLRVYNGALMYYRKQVLADDIYGNWFKVNVIHNTTAGQHKVFINGDLKLVVADHREDTHYFKFGVYAQNYSSYFMESLWKDIKISAIY